MHAGMVMQGVFVALFLVALTTAAGVVAIGAAARSSARSTSGWISDML
jgi:hypothetical protein